VTSSEDGTVKIWETRSGTIQRSYSHGSPVNDVVIHPNQGEIISCDRGGSVRIWDLAENNCSHQLIPEEEVSISSVTVATDGSTLCAGSNSVNLLNTDCMIIQLINLTGQRLRLASNAIPREDHSGTTHAFQGSHSIHHPSPTFTRCEAPRHMQCRPHRQNLGNQGPREDDTHARWRSTTGTAIQVGEYLDRSSEMGLGLCV
jgi:hypothetical protein